MTQTSDLAAPVTSPCVLKAKMIDSYGYARVYVGVGANARQLYAHRWAWEQAHGPIPPDMTIDHMCCVPNCYNVEHLQMVTRSENSRLRQVRKQQTHCKHGHPLTPENLIPNKRWRGCKICHNNQQKVRYQKLKHPERIAEVDVKPDSINVADLMALVQQGQPITILGVVYVPAETTDHTLKTGRMR